MTSMVLENAHFLFLLAYAADYMLAMYYVRIHLIILYQLVNKKI